MNRARAPATNHSHPGGTMNFTPDPIRRREMLRRSLLAAGALLVPGSAFALTEDDRARLAGWM
ncbi:MAG: hypothetical protein ICV87_06625, partial [Gemmatimonadetes bacterium]|nr:hypothetical protein [Gemmatimonadota bacterium]